MRFEVAFILGLLVLGVVGTVVASWLGIMFVEAVLL